MLFVLCHSGDTKALAVLKVERDEGVQIDRQKTEDGHTRFNVTHIENLMLTKNTKLFKIAMFYRDEVETKGLLSDQQMGINGNKDVAMFFLRTFSACKLEEDPSVATKRFFELTQRFVNESDLPAEKKADIVIHMISALTNNDHAISIEQFARTCIDDYIADDYLAYLKEKGSTSECFVKDTAMIARHLNNSKFTFKSGIYVIAPQETLNQNLKYEESDNGRITMQITDTLKKIEAK